MVSFRPFRRLRTDLLSERFCSYLFGIRCCETVKKGCAFGAGNVLETGYQFGVSIRGVCAETCELVGVFSGTFVVEHAYYLKAGRFFIVQTSASFTLRLKRGGVIQRGECKA